MDPLTHALTSLAAARAARKRLPRFGVWIVVAAGLSPGLDAASVWIGAAAYLRLHLGLLHGILGAPLLACIIAASACSVARRIPSKENSPPLRFLPALAAATLGVSLHLALDYLSGPGVMFLWPFRLRWWGCELVQNFDPWLLAVLVAGILIPELVSMVGEEIGERKQGPRGRVAALTTLVLITGYLGFRAELRARAINLLMSSDYHHRAPLEADAFPMSANPFSWRGVVSTDNTIEEVFVPVGQPDEFDSDHSLSYYKPANSLPLQAAEDTRAAKQFLAYARFPLVNVEESHSGWTVTLRDLRFSPADPGPENIIAVVQFNNIGQVQSSALEFSSGSSR
ncbi:MAG TPA: metal-dependent hydrolase [Candidatus Acidoferrum sp.]|nr:metal-dependent hydrolase [Candidatus Acidoferrum sp.]